MCLKHTGEHGFERHDTSLNKLIEEAKASADPVAEVAVPSVSSKVTMASVTGDVTTITALLQHATLEKYATCIEEADYVELDDLLAADDSDLEELAATVKMSKPATGRFLRAVASARKNAAPA